MWAANQVPEANPIPVCLARSSEWEKIISRVYSETIAGFPAAMMADFSWHLMSAWVLNIYAVDAQALKLTCSLGSCRPA